MRFALLFLVFVLAGCGSKTTRFEREPGVAPRRTAIIFVPGYYGSALADEETGERVFISAWSAAFSSVPLANTVPDLGVEGARKLRADGVLEHLRVVPPFFSFDIYGNSLGFLRDRFGERADIVPFDYDWRQELSRSAARLETLVEKLRAEGVGKIGIVAHSMGGLVVAYYLRYGGQDPRAAVDHGNGSTITAAIIGGTPFAGTPHAFRNLQHGTALGWTKEPLQALCLGTFPSMYQLVPIAGSDGFRDGTGKPLGPEVLTPEFWRTHRLGLFKKRGTPPADVQKRREAFASEGLQLAAKFHERLRAPVTKPRPAPAMLYLVGTGTPTFSHAVWKAATKSGEAGSWLYEADDENVFSIDGDNTVTAGSATPPAGLLASLPGKVLKAKSAHESIYNEEVFRTAVETFLNQSLFGGGLAVADQQ